MADRDMTLPYLGPRLQELARRFGLAGFWPWWVKELDALVPFAARAALARRRMRPVFVFDGGEATLWRPAMENGRAVMKRAASIALTGDAAGVTAAGHAALSPLTRIAYGGAVAPTRVVISLPLREVLRKKLTLPAAVEENFRQALAYDLDRHTPFKAEELYFDAAIDDRNPARNTITVDLAAARRAVVDPALKHALAWGAEVVAVVPEPPESAASSRLNLLPPELRAPRSAWARWQFWLPAAIVGALLLAAVLIPLWQKRDYAIQLIALADQARGRAAISETLRQELGARVGDYNIALERKYAFPGALQVVDNVSKLLPDDTWLTQFELKSVAKGKETQRELLVRGESANAGRLVQMFEESQLFAQAAPRSQTTKIQPGPGEIFDLGAQLKPLPKPAPVSVLARDEPAAAPAAAPASPPAPVTAAPAASPVAAPAPSGAMAPAPAAPPPPPSPAAGTPPGSATTAAPPAAPPAPPPTSGDPGKMPGNGPGRRP